MQHLPPSGWDNVATKEDLRAAFAEINSAMTAGFAQAAVERAEIVKAMTERLAQATVERAEIKAEAATERAEIIRRQAWHLYIVVSTIAVASVSIWIALLTQSGAGG